MEIKITTKQVLKVLLILSWVIFIGLCVEAGGILFNAFYVFFINAQGATNFWNKMNLSSLYNFDSGQFITVTICMSIVAILKALLFYLIVKILHDKKLDVVQPFNNEMKRFISNVAYIAISIGIFCYWGSKYTKWLTSKGVMMPDLQSLGLEGGAIWLFMGITILVIAQIFKRGIEIQTENDLTI
jgi:hypothetical protein